MLFTTPFLGFGQCDLSENVIIQDFTTTSIPILVDNAILNDLSDPDQGVCGLFISFEHTHIGDIIVELVSPAGQSILIIGKVVNSGNTSATNWDVFFTSCNAPASPDPGFNPTWSNNQSWGILGNYSGTYYPNSGCLEDFDSGPVNGTWILNIIDANLFDTGELLSFSILFCDPQGLDCTDCFEVQNESEIIGDTLNCSNPSVTLILDSPFQFDSLTWEGPDGFQSDENSPVVDVPGLYFVNAYFQDICSSYFEYNLVQDIYEPEIEAKDGYIDCNTKEIQLNLTVENVDTVESYYWEGPNSFTSDKMQPEIYEGGNYFVTVTNKNGCSSTTNLNVEANFQIPEIILEDINLSCNSDSVQVEINTNIPIVKYNWEGPNGFNSTIPEPKVIDTGIYILIIEAFNGCMNSDTLHVSQINEVPEYQIEQIGALNCKSDSILFIAKEVEDDGYFEWSNANGLISLEDSIVISEGGLLQFKIIGLNECVDSTSILVEYDTIKPLINIETEGYLKCTTQSMELTSNGSSFGDSISYEWFTENGIITSDLNETSININMEGLYFLIVEDTLSGCISIDSIEIFELENDLHDLTAELFPPSCPDVDNGMIILSEILGGKPPFLYALNEGIFTSDQKFTDLQEGEYIISVMDQDGCQLTSSVILDAQDLFQVDLGPDIEVPFGELVTIVLNASISVAAIDSIIWEPSGLTSCTDCTEIEVFAMGDSNIVVSVIDTNGCLNFSSINISVLHSNNYYIPNIFSPNQDGVNDYFYVQSQGAVKSIERMIVFDKRGIPYYDAHNITVNEELEGWNGQWDQKEADAGVYIYYIQLVLNTGEDLLITGDITLIR